MARLAGFGGQLDWGSIIDSDVAYGVHGWSLDHTSDPYDVTDFTTTGDKDFIGGLKGWSGSIELKVDGTNSIVPSDVGSSAAVRLYFNSTTGLSGTAICTGWHPSVAVDSEETQTLDFQGTGALTAF